jgi:predicted Fe-S protein YdhL (DUF1289 family)
MPGSSSALPHWLNYTQLEKQTVLRELFQRERQRAIASRQIQPSAYSATAALQPAHQDLNRCV